MTNVPAETDRFAEFRSRTDGESGHGDGLTPAARRALAEAEARRRAHSALDLPPEQGGPKGPEPVRYGDWERKGRAVDF